METAFKIGDIIVITQGIWKKTEGRILKVDTAGANGTKYFVRLRMDGGMQTSKWFYPDRLRLADDGTVREAEIAENIQSGRQS